MKKNLVFLIGGLNFGGMERVVFIAKELLKNDYKVTIVTQYQNNADYEKKDDYYNLDVPPSKNKLLVFLKRLFRCIKMKRKLKPDFVFSFGMYSNYLNVFSNVFLKRKPKTIAGIRSYDWLTDSFVSSKIDKYVMNKFDSINSVSKLIAMDAEKYWGIPINKNKIVYNPYDIKMIERKASEQIDDYIFKKNVFYIISMGRLANQKGYNNLIRTMSLVCKKIDNIELLILGNGEKKEPLLNMIKEYGLESNIKLLGGKLNPYKYIKNCNLYVLSSITEGFPNALSEAMCVGTPVVAVNCKSGPAEIILGKPNIELGKKSYIVSKYGILSKEMTQDGLYCKRDLNDPEKSLAEAIIYAYNHEKEIKNMSKNAKKHMEIFSYEKFKDNLETAIK